MIEDAIGQIAGIMNTFPDIKEIKTALFDRLKRNRNILDIE